MSEYWQYYTDDGLVHFYHNGIEVGIDRVFDMLNMQDQRIAELEAKVKRAEQKQREAEGMVERLIKAGNAKSQESFGEWHARRDKWLSLVAEWQARNG